MKTPKLIIQALASGRVRLTPEVLEALKRLHLDPPLVETEQPQPPSQAPTSDLSPDAPNPPDKTFPPDQPKPEDSSNSAPRLKCDSRRRMVFVSPLPGRWVRLCGMTLSCLALWLAHPVRGQEQDFEAANRAAVEGKWVEAVHGYQSVTTSRGYSAPVLFNLANAEVAQNELGLAILNYERARWLAPNDMDISANLALVRQKAGLDPETPSRLVALAHSLTSTQWAIVATTMLWLLLATLSFRRVLPRAMPALRTGAVLCGLVLTASLSALALRWPDLDRAIVTATEARAQVSPITGIRPLFTLRAGEAVTIKRVHGTFVLVADRQGREGWVSGDAITPIVCDGRAGGAEVRNKAQTSGRPRAALGG